MYSITKEQERILHTPIPEQFIEYKDGQAYVNHNLISGILNKAFGLAWSFSVIEQGIEEVKSYNKKTEGQPKSYYCWVKGRIKYPVENEKGDVIFMEREHYGGKAIVGNSQVQANAFKSAASDALKKVASTLGVAQNVYMKPAIYNALLEEETAADSWNEGNLARFASEIKIMDEFSKTMSKDGVADIINRFCDEIGDYTFYGSITPSNIQAFIAWLYDNKLVEQPKDENVTPKVNPFKRRVMK